MSLRSNSKKLTEQRMRFVKNVVMGMTQTAAARDAGYKHPTVEAYQLMRLPVINEAIRMERGKYEHASNMTRKKVIDGLKEAIDLARLMAEPASMVGGWREIARICGYYAPETRKVDISVNGAVQISQLESLSDADLLKLVIEGESVVVDEDSEQMALLEAPVAELGDDDPPAESVV